MRGKPRMCVRRSHSVWDLQRCKCGGEQRGVPISCYRDFWVYTSTSRTVVLVMVPMLLLEQSVLLMLIVIFVLQVYR